MNNGNRPRMLILAGPNGAGKTTFSSTLLAAQEFHLQFLNADDEARQISPANAPGAAIRAARTVLQRMAANVRVGQSCAVETTLSGRAHLKPIAVAAAAGWTVELYFLWLRSVELAKERVAARVATGGHDIPQEVVLRRYIRGLNLLPVYCREVSRWTIFDNSGRVVRKVASGRKKQISIDDEQVFEGIKSYSHEKWQ